MTASRVRFGAMAAGLCCLLAGYVVAQQSVQDRTRDATDRAQSSQTDRLGAQQQDQFESGQATTQTRQRGQIQARGGQISPEVEKYLAKCLLLKNNSEIELSQFAQQKAQNPEVKQFAQQMIQDHQQIGQQLQQVAGAQGRAGDQTGASGQYDAQRQTSDTTRLPGSSGASQATRTETNTSVAQGNPGQQGGDQALMQLAQIEQQIVERSAQMTRDELEQKQGADFDKCFVGAQVGAHMHMLAALETIAQQGEGKLAQAAQQAQPVVQQHLEHAKHLAKQLEQGQTQSPRAAGQAERQQPRTQR